MLLTNIFEVTEKKQIERKMAADKSLFIQNEYTKSIPSFDMITKIPN